MNGNKNEIEYIKSDISITDITYLQYTRNAKKW